MFFMSDTKAVFFINDDKTQVGKLEVARVKEKIAYCKAIEGGEAIKKGMTVLIPE